MKDKGSVWDETVQGEKSVTDQVEIVGKNIYVFVFFRFKIFRFWIEIPKLFKSEINILDFKLRIPTS